MGRKKINIAKITDERNRQVSRALSLATGDLQRSFGMCGVNTQFICLKTGQSQPDLARSWPSGGVCPVPGCSVRIAPILVPDEEWPFLLSDFRFAEQSALPVVATKECKEETGEAFSLVVSICWQTETRVDYWLQNQ